MLIVCPNCATSYMVDQAALGPDGRTVRCARCKRTWFAGGQTPAPEINEFVDGVIAEAEAQTAGGAYAQPPHPAAYAAPLAPPPTPAAEDDFGAADDFGGESEQPIAATEPAETSAEVMDSPPGGPELAPEPHFDAPSLVPPGEHEPLPEPEAGHTEADAEDVESYAVRRQRLKARRKQSRRSSRWTALVLVLFAVNVAVIGGRDEVVRYLPQTASLFAAIGLPVNLRHLAFENVKISKDIQDGVSVLVVEGTIASTASKPIAVPRLRFAARNAAGQEIYTWTALPSRSILGPGEKLQFRSRLASPPADASNVLVRFFNAHDAEAAGMAGAAGAK